MPINTTYNQARERPKSLMERAVDGCEVIESHACNGTMLLTQG